MDFESKTTIQEVNEDETTQLQFKVILLGDGSVGKTSICTRFSQDYFSKPYKQTIGLDLFLKRLELPGGVEVTLQLWDIGGQTIGGNMIGNYIHGADAILLCYDISSYYSFQNLEDWLRLVKNVFPRNALPLLALVANKMDLTHLRTVKVDNHEQFAEENDMYTYQVSAKSGDGVHSSFFQIAADLAGVVLTKPDLQVSNLPIEANIVNHQQNDPEVREPDLLHHSKKCIVQ